MYWPHTELTLLPVRLTSTTTLWVIPFFVWLPNGSMPKLLDWKRKCRKEQERMVLYQEPTRKRQQQCLWFLKGDILIMLLCLHHSRLCLSSGVEDIPPGWLTGKDHHWGNTIPLGCFFRKLWGQSRDPSLFDISLESWCRTWKGEGESESEPVPLWGEDKHGHMSLNLNEGEEGWWAWMNLWEREQREWCEEECAV